jgi:hypothetical protein
LKAEAVAACPDAGATGTTFGTLVTPSGTLKFTSQTSGADILYTVNNQTDESQTVVWTGTPIQGQTLTIPASSQQTLTVPIHGAVSNAMTTIQAGGLSSGISSQAAFSAVVPVTPVPVLGEATNGRLAGLFLVLVAAGAVTAAKVGGIRRRRKASS